MPKFPYEFIVVSKRNSEREIKTRQNYRGSIPEEYLPIISNVIEAHKRALKNCKPQELQILETSVLIS